MCVSMLGRLLVRVPVHGVGETVSCLGIPKRAFEESAHRHRTPAQLPGIATPGLRMVWSALLLRWHCSVLYEISTYCDQYEIK